MSHFLSNVAGGLEKVGQAGIDAARLKSPRKVAGEFTKGSTETLGPLSGPVGKVAGPLAPVAGAVAGSLIPGLGTIAGGALGGAVGGYLSAPEGSITKDTVIGGVGGAVGGAIGGAATGADLLPGGAGAGAGGAAATAFGDSGVGMTGEGIGFDWLAGSAAGEAGGGSAAGAGINLSADIPSMASGIAGGGGPTEDLATMASGPQDLSSSSLAQNMVTGPGGSATTAPGGGGGSSSGGLLPRTTLGKLGMGLGLLSTGYGLYTGSQMMKLAKEQAARADPFGPYRSGYAQQLNDLMANPTSVTSQPGYKFGLEQGEQGVSRAAAKQGLNLTPAESLALKQYDQNYAQSYYQNQVSTLSNLAGAGIPPTSGATALGGSIAGTQLIGSSLGNLGYMVGRNDQPGAPPGA